jgi:hypothetical protein
MRSFAVLCIIATVAAVDTQAEYTGKTEQRAHGAADGHIAGEVNTLESNHNDYSTMVDHSTGEEVHLALGDSTPGSGNQWCNTQT